MICSLRDTVSCLHADSVAANILYSVSVSYDFYLQTASSCCPVNTREKQFVCEVLIWLEDVRLDQESMAPVGEDRYIHFMVSGCWLFSLFKKEKRKKKPPLSRSPSVVTFHGNYMH